MIYLIYLIRGVEHFPHRREALKLSHGPLPVVHVLA